MEVNFCIEKQIASAYIGYFCGFQYKAKGEKIQN